MDNLRYIKTHAEKHAMRLVLTLKILGYELNNGIRDGIVYDLDDTTILGNLEDAEDIIVEMDAKYIRGISLKKKSEIAYICPIRPAITMREFIEELAR